MDRERASIGSARSALPTCGYRPQTLNLDSGERALEHDRGVTTTGGKVVERARRRRGEGASLGEMVRDDDAGGVVEHDDRGRIPRGNGT